MLNEAGNVRPYHAGAGYAAGTIEVPVVDYRKPNNFGAVSLDGVSNAKIQAETPGEKVPVMTVDSLGLSRLDLLKIDVEGMERAVLLGATEAIRRCRPLLYFEADRKDRNKALFETAMSFGYRLFWHLPRLYSPKNFFGNERNVFGDIVSFNVVGVTRERGDDMPKGQEISSPEQVWP